MFGLARSPTHQARSPRLQKSALTKFPLANPMSLEAEASKFRNQLVQPANHGSHAIHGAEHHFPTLGDEPPRRAQFDMGPSRGLQFFKVAEPLEQATLESSSLANLLFDA